MAFSKPDAPVSNTDCSQASGQPAVHKTHHQISDWIPAMNAVQWICVISILLVGVLLIGWAAFDRATPTPKQSEAYVPEPGSATAEQAKSLEAVRAEIRADAPKTQKGEIAAQEKNAAAERKAWADLYEAVLLAQGMDVSTSVSGRNNTTLKITYALMSRPVVFQLRNTADFRNGIQENGFKKVILTDGYSRTWTLEF